ncbi:MAG: 1-deoxy-D-xylulose-5-phosphate reductoisomerase [Bacteroidetes bacterium CG02_land_8_20_14_3_00_31_25]|nr:MAG: 1-deoxy-D-xylulose-5-phosphate reductoisomerase [Bacteroidetes bacterium CG02_land_8_20_14_3_00_31_25]PIX32927.1 MAG: 1-deoxy-D-xylulose-5-phosphate reductoisomerase [Bacteroidetes bacterium CG_4_8_14_3_um_filter_31_14]PIY02064.1 MAG: 1-deoxy-D-xylulose-5-phosphate reductoisomerase [Bacteroidetes bacterium CG_4_10_14_3_um_filter_31_20]
MKKRIAILGSTGSIGTQSLEVISFFPDFFEVEVLTANNNSELLIFQARKYNPNTVIIANENKYLEVKNALSDLAIKVFAGNKSISDIVESDNVDIVIAAMVGFSGLIPVLNALENNKKVALANKETLVVAGSLIKEISKRKTISIIPVDSEHSAIFQCLVGENEKAVDKLILTASGGPFRNKKIEELEKVTVKQALAHPNWTMGAKVTIDSATMMNKGLEIIEAHWLFNVPTNKIEVVVHPQSIIHSMVQFTDGSVKAQLGLPDMRTPIQYALTYPNRFENKLDKIDFAKLNQLTFETPDFKKFPCLNLAYYALNKGGNMPCIMNAANEIAVQKFLNEKIKFTEIPKVTENTMQKATFIKNPSLNDLITTDSEAREIAKKNN